MQSRKVEGEAESEPPFLSPNPLQSVVQAVRTSLEKYSFLRVEMLQWIKIKQRRNLRSIRKEGI